MPKIIDKIIKIVHKRFKNSTVKGLDIFKSKNRIK